MHRTKEQNINSNVMMFTILMMSSMIMINNSVLMPLLGNIEQTYPNVSDLLLQGILTLPAITIMLSMIMSSYLSRYLSPKIIIIIGFIIFTVCGVALTIPMPFSSFITLRLIFGIGIGLTNPFINTLTVNYFTGDKQTKLMGYSNSARVLGGTFATAFAGMIASYDWHYAPFLYAMALVPLVVTLFGMDNEKLPPLKKGAYSLKSIFTVRINIIIFLQMFLVLIDFVYLTNIALVLSERNISAPESSSILIITFNIMTMILSAAFFTFYKRLNFRIIYVSSVCISSAFLIFTFAHTFTFMIIGSLFMGVPAGLLAPLLIHELNDAIVYRETTMTVFTAFAISVFLGQFASPIIVAFLRNLFHLHGTTGAFSIGFLFTIIYFTALLYYFKIIVPKYSKKELV